LTVDKEADVTGGVAFGIRNFWESHPAQLDIRNARTEQAEVTMWLWAPDAPPIENCSKGGNRSSVYWPLIRNSSVWFTVRLFSHE
jgi:hypothetical protein